MHVEFRRNDNAIRARYATDASLESPKAGNTGSLSRLLRSEGGRPIGVADYSITLSVYFADMIFIHACAAKIADATISVHDRDIIPAREGPPRDLNVNRPRQF